jgi:hypothetical protein
MDVKPLWLDEVLQLEGHQGKLEWAHSVRSRERRGRAAGVSEAAVAHRHCGAQHSHRQAPFDNCRSRRYGLPPPARSATGTAPFHLGSGRVVMDGLPADIPVFSGGPFLYAGDAFRACRGGGPGGTAKDVSLDVGHRARCMPCGRGVFPALRVIRSAGILSSQHVAIAKDEVRAMLTYGAYAVVGLSFVLWLRRGRRCKESKPCT